MDDRGRSMQRREDPVMSAGAPCSNFILVFLFAVILSFRGIIALYLLNDRLQSILLNAASYFGAGFEKK